VSSRSNWTRYLDRTADQLAAGIVGGSPTGYATAGSSRAS
jgi:hypothetical protein